MAIALESVSQLHFDSNTLNLGFCSEVVVFLPSIFFEMFLPDPWMLSGGGGGQSIDDKV